MKNKLKYTLLFSALRAFGPGLMDFSGLRALEQIGRAAGSGIVKAALSRIEKKEQLEPRVKDYSQHSSKIGQNIILSALARIGGYNPQNVTLNYCEKIAKTTLAKIDPKYASLRCKYEPKHEWVDLVGVDIFERIVSLANNAEFSEHRDLFLSVIYLYQAHFKLIECSQDADASTNVDFTTQEKADLKEELEKKIEELNNQILSLEGMENDAVRDYKVKLEAQVETIQELKAESQKEKEELRQSLENLYAAQLHSLNEEISSLNQNLNSRDKENADLRDCIASDSHRIEVLLEEKESLIQNLASRDKENEDLTDLNESYSEKIRSLSEEMANLRQTIESLTKDNEELKEFVERDWEPVVLPIGVLDSEGGDSQECKAAQALLESVESKLNSPEVVLQQISQFFSPDLITFQDEMRARARFSEWGINWKADQVSKAQVQKIAKLALEKLGASEFGEDPLDSVCLAMENIASRQENEANLLKSVLVAYKTYALSKI